MRLPLYQTAVIISPQYYYQYYYRLLARRPYSQKSFLCTRQFTGCVTGSTVFFIRRQPGNGSISSIIFLLQRWRPTLGVRGQEVGRSVPGLLVLLADIRNKWIMTVTSAIMLLWTGMISVYRYYIRLEWATPCADVAGCLVYAGIHYAFSRQHIPSLFKKWFTLISHVDKSGADCSARGHPLSYCAMHLLERMLCL